jgi:hypothetical protein
MRHLTKIVIMSLGALGACSSSDNDADNNVTVQGANGTITVDFADSLNFESGILFLGADPFDPNTVDINGNVVTVSKVIPSQFTPAGCATATPNGNVLTLQLNSCNGPFGLTAATGTITLAYAPIAGGVQITASSTNLTTANASLNLDAVAHFTASGASRTLSVQTNSSGTGPNGNSVARQGSFSIAWQAGAQCVAVNGTMNTPTESVSSWQICRAACPASGTVTRTDTTTGVTTTLTFAGTPNVAFTTSDGNTGTATFACQ